MLQTRFTNRVSPDEAKSFENAIHLFHRVSDSAQHNAKMLALLPEAPAFINALHTPDHSLARRAPATETYGLLPSVAVAIGCRILLICNLLTSIGLANGCLGTVIDILYAPNTKPPDLPIAVVVQLDEMYKGPSFKPELGPRIVPLAPYPVNFEYKGNAYSRLQIPVMLAFASTVHRAQGGTLPRAFIDIGPKRDPPNAPGLAFVALSRVKKLNDCLLRPFSEDFIFNFLKVSASLIELNFMKNLSKLLKKLLILSELETVSYSFFLVSSFRLKI